MMTELEDRTPRLSPRSSPITSNFEHHINLDGSSSDGEPQVAGLGELDNLDSPRSIPLLTEQQVAHKVLQCFSGDTQHALPHLIKALKQDPASHGYINRHIKYAERAGFDAGTSLFVPKQEQPRRDFLSTMESALPVAQELVKPIVDALTDTSEQLQTSEADKTQLQSQHDQLKARSRWYTLAGAVASSILTAGVTVGLAFANDAISGTTSSCPTVQCVLTLVNGTLGG
jgi:hypothetical protein